MAPKLKWTNSRALERAIKVYFDNCDKNGHTPTVTGLCNQLDTNRDTLLEYEKGKSTKNLPERTINAISYQIRKAKRRCEEALVQGGLNGKIYGGMVMFLLKNHYGYVDKQEINQTVTLNTAQAAQDAWAKHQLPNNTAKLAGPVKLLPSYKAIKQTRQAAKQAETGKDSPPGPVGPVKPDSKTDGDKDS